VPYGEKTAVNGKWLNGPGGDFFKDIRKKVVSKKIIVDDLGVTTEEMIRVRDKYEFPGMKLLQFAFGSDGSNTFLPHHYQQNSVVYTGTHDNDTLTGWYKKMNRIERKFLKSYLNRKDIRINWDIISLAWSSVAVYAITTMQDIIGLGSETRMNTPGTTQNNWKWRYESSQITRIIKFELKKITSHYGR